MASPSFGSLPVDEPHFMSAMTGSAGSSGDHRVPKRGRKREIYLAAVALQPTPDTLCAANRPSTLFGSPYNKTAQPFYSNHVHTSGDRFPASAESPPNSVDDACRYLGIINLLSCLTAVSPGSADQRFGARLG